MATATVENIVALINQSPELECARLIAELVNTHPAQPQLPQGRLISTNAPSHDRRLDYEWLAQHQREYIGQWVALKEGQLLAHSKQAKEVFAKAREVGMAEVLVLLVEDPDVPCMNI